MSTENDSLPGLPIVLVETVWLLLRLEISSSPYSDPNSQTSLELQA